MLLIIFAGAVLPRPAQAAPAGSRIPWQGGNWYLQGANVPWYNWGCDFGCGANGGVSSPAVQSALAGPFGQLRAAGAHVVRWWAFEGNAWQIAQDGNGAPTGLNPAVYADFDAALALAQQDDLYYDFVLFSAPTAIPTAWETDPAQRQALANALAPLFARYKGNPHVLSWEVFNEPEYDIWNGKIAQSAVQATVQAIAASVHANSTAYVTVGSAMLDGLPLWEGLGLDFYEAHWYDYMSSGNYCARCTDYPTVQARYNLDAPLVIGETYAGPDTDAYQRFADFYNKGYAGYWPWSLFPSKTSDGMSIDLGAMQTFDSQHSDIGPASGGGSTSTTTSASSTSSAATTTTATQTASTTASGTTSGASDPGTPTFQISATVNPATAAPGAPVTITADVQELTGALSDGVVAVDVMDASGRQLLSQPASGQNLAAGQAQTYSYTWTAPGTPGTYTILVAVFAAGWSPRYALEANAATLTVATDTSSTTTSSAASSAATSASTTTPQSATSTSASTTSVSATTGSSSASSTASSTAGAGTPSFSTSANLSSQVVATGTPVTITANVQDIGGALANGVVEVEVLDAAGNRPFNQYATGQDFAASQARSYQYTWTPSAAGTYTVMIAVYGPGWSQRYAFNGNAGTITVH